MNQPFNVTFRNYSGEHIFLSEDNMLLVPSKGELITIEGVTYKVIDRQFDYTNGLYSCDVYLKRIGFCD